MDRDLMARSFEELCRIYESDAPRISASEIERVVEIEKRTPREVYLLLRNNGVRELCAEEEEYVRAKRLCFGDNRTFGNLYHHINPCIYERQIKLIERYIWGEIGIRDY